MQAQQTNWKHFIASKSLIATRLLMIRADIKRHHMIKPKEHEIILSCEEGRNSSPTFQKTFFYDVNWNYCSNKRKGRMKPSHGTGCAILLFGQLFVDALSVMSSLGMRPMMIFLKFELFFTSKRTNTPIEIGKVCHGWCSFTYNAVQRKYSNYELQSLCGCWCVCANICVHLFHAHA